MTKRPAPDPSADLPALTLRETPEGIEFEVRVAPRASRAAITGVYGGALKVSLSAPPVDGAANQALIELLAKALGVPKSALVIKRGERSRNKRLGVRGLSAAAVCSALRVLLGT